MSLFRSLALALTCLGVTSALTWRPALAQEQHPLPRTVAEGARLTVEYEAEHFFEGPTWDPGTGKLYFTSFPSGERVNTQILRLDDRGRASVWMDRTEGINGTYLAKDGRFLGAQAFGHNLYSMRIGKEGPEELKSLTNHFQGVPYLQPNDVCQSLVTGGIYYTDPNFAGRTRSAVYYLSPEGRVHRIIENLKVPNGVEVSNDGKTLFVGDSFELRIYSYPILPDGTVDQGRVRVFFDPQTANQNAPDGMCTDAEGNLYFAMRGGVWVVTPEGKSLGLIPIPEFCSNVTFGGPDGKTLYMTCSKKVYSLRMNAAGPTR
ncbi:MAG: SMP-30/gluconolactonase/LRE family protein [Armatimonadota bacterium]